MFVLLVLPDYVCSQVMSAPLGVTLHGYALRYGLTYFAQFLFFRSPSNNHLARFQSGLHLRSKEAALLLVYESETFSRPA